MQSREAAKAGGVAAAWFIFAPLRLRVSHGLDGSQPVTSSARLSLPNPCYTAETQSERREYPRSPFFLLGVLCRLCGATARDLILGSAALVGVWAQTAKPLGRKIEGRNILAAGS